MAIPAFSVVVPVLNEAENVAPLVREIQAAFAQRTDYEILLVDDGSTDATVAEIHAIRKTVPQVRLLRHASRRGQSMALLTGVRAARAPWIATLDGDGQNDPADLPRLLAMVEGVPDRNAPRLIMGHRRSRQDTWVRRISSRIANGVRRRILQDDTPDTGCGIKVMHRGTFLGLPAFDHMHRFLPALFQSAGAPVASVEVRHRPRLRGQSKYGIGNRLWVGIVDLFGVRWLIRRAPGPSAVTEE